MNLHQKLFFLPDSNRVPRVAEDVSEVDVFSRGYADTEKMSRNSRMRFFTTPFSLKFFTGGDFLLKIPFNSLY
jgi:hypothetical protein